MSQTLIDLLKYIKSDAYKKRESFARTELYFIKAIQHIRDLEKNAGETMSKDDKERIKQLQEIISNNNAKYIAREQTFINSIDNLKNEIKILKTKLPKEEILKQEFTCDGCGLSGSKEFLRFVDRRGKRYCMDCMDAGTEEVQKETGQIVTIEKVSDIKSFICEFCKQLKYETPEKDHVLNMPDGRDSKDISIVCKSCSIEKCKKDLRIQYCPRTTGPRDSYELSEYDCNCPTVSIVL